MKYFVTAIGTDSGKTVISAILCTALKAAYWKPVQAGFPTDSETVRSLAGSDLTIFPERYLLKTPASPHAAAKIEGIDIALNDFNLPLTKQRLIIEGAGGCLVPLNDKDFVIDLALKFGTEVILVSNLYLGSINHTLLTYEAIRARGLTIKGIIFNGIENPESKRIILHHTSLPCLLDVQQEASMDSTIVKRYAELLKSNWNG